MPVCDNCGHHWSWKQTMKSMWTLSTGWKCPNCSKKQYPTKQSRKRHMLANMVIPLFILLPNLLDLSLFAALTLMFTIAAVVLMTMPLYTDVQSEEEPLW